MKIRWFFFPFFFFPQKKKNHRVSTEMQEGMLSDINLPQLPHGLNKKVYFDLTNETHESLVLSCTELERQPPSCHSA